MPCWCIYNPTFPSNWWRPWQHRIKKISGDENACFTVLCSQHFLTKHLFYVVCGVKLKAVYELIQVKTQLVMPVLFMTPVSDWSHVTDVTWFYVTSVSAWYFSGHVTSLRSLFAHSNETSAVHVCRYRFGIVLELSVQSTRKEYTGTVIQPERPWRFHGFIKKRMRSQETNWDDQSPSW